MISPAFLLLERGLGWPVERRPNAYPVAAAPTVLVAHSCMAEGQIISSWISICDDVCLYQVTGDEVSRSHKRKDELVGKLGHHGHDPVAASVKFTHRRYSVHRTQHSPDSPRTTALSASGRGCKRSGWLSLRIHGLNHGSQQWPQQ